MQAGVVVAVAVAGQLAADQSECASDATCPPLSLSLSLVHSFARSLDRGYMSFRSVGRSLARQSPISICFARSNGMTTLYDVGSDGRGRAGPAGRNRKRESSIGKTRGILFCTYYTVVHVCSTVRNLLPVSCSPSRIYNFSMNRVGATSIPRNLFPAL